MAITDINISEQLETDAPSIKYTGNEGPQASPQHQQEMQQDEAQDQGQGPQGIGSLGPGPMEQMPMPNRMGAEYGGRIGFQQGGDPEVMKKVKFYVEVMGMSPQEALQRVTSQSEGSFPRPEISPPQTPLRSRGLFGIRPQDRVEEFQDPGERGIESLRGRP
jgi:hypothetical protein